MEDLKREVARRVVERYVESGMVLGLGSGSTASWVVRRIGELLGSGELVDVRGIATSKKTERLALEVGLPLLSLDVEQPTLTIDGANEISPDLDAIKGRGGSLLREKIVASASREGLLIVVDESKEVETLGRGPLPVEVEPFGCDTTLEALAALGCEPELRLDGGRAVLTDGGHYTVDCQFSSITEPAALEREIKNIPGALECGLFVGLARDAIVARETGV